MQYQRQIILNELGQQGQEILSVSKVLVVGAGGLGHPAIQYLISMGVGHIGVVDGDVVSESNLHRQVLFNSNDIGKSKVETIKDYFQQRHQSQRIKTYNSFLNKNLALELFRGYDLVLDGTDNFESKLLINDVCCLYDKPMVFGSVSQFEGQVSVFWRRHGPCYRCLVPQKPLSDIKNCAEAGVVGALPGIIGTMQALEALKTLLLQKGKASIKPLIGSIAQFNFLENSSLKLNLPIRKHCFCQSRNLDETKIDEVQLAASCDQVPSELVDVREFDEFSHFSVPGVLHWPLSQLLKGEFPPVSKDKKLVAICKTGARAQKATELLRSNGFNRVSFTRKSIYGYQIR